MKSIHTQCFNGVDKTTAGKDVLPRALRNLYLLPSYPDMIEGRCASCVHGTPVSFLAAIDMGMIPLKLRIVNDLCLHHNVGHNSDLLVSLVDKESRL